jgi:hypothetical protein
MAQETWLVVSDRMLNQYLQQLYITVVSGITKVPAYSADLRSAIRKRECDRAHLMVISQVEVFLVYRLDR